MNDVQNPQNQSKKSKIPRSLIWGGSIGAIVIAFVVLLVILMSSSETPTAFLAKWKNALESGSVKRYEAIWVKRARQRPDTGYQETVSLLKGGARLEVNLGGTTQTFRVPRYPNRYRIEGIPVTAHFSENPSSSCEIWLSKNRDLFNNAGKLSKTKSSEATSLQRYQTLIPRSRMSHSRIAPSYQSS